MGGLGRRQRTDSASALLQLPEARTKTLLPPAAAAWGAHQNITSPSPFSRMDCCGACAGLAGLRKHRNNPCVPAPPSSGLGFSSQKGVYSRFRV